MFCLWLIALVLVAIYLYLAIKKSYRYWEERSVACKKPTLLFGNVGAILARKKNYFDFMIDLYNEFPDKRYNGTYQIMKPILIVRDIELMKKMTIKDFEYFTDHLELGSGAGDKLLTKSIFNLKGQDWKEMRCTLSPAFTSSKMRNIYTFMCECVEKFTDHLLEKNEKLIKLEMREMVCKFANDVIASAAFGVNCNTFEKPDNEFYRMGLLTSSSFRGFQVILSFFVPKLYQFLQLRIFPKPMVDFFTNIVTDNIKQREKRGIFRPDMIHLLMEAKKGRLKHETAKIDVKELVDGFSTAQESQIGKDACQKKDMTDEDIVAQVTLFFFAGFDTVSLVTCLMAYELALNPDVQEKLREEIRETRKQCGVKISYEKLLGMKYLDMVVSESMRKWPPAFRLDRICVKDYLIPPERDGEKPFTVEKGQTVFFPVVGIHRDPKFFPNPMKFDPERFSDERSSTIIPGSYLPFGIGPRNCIGSRFALLEIKTLFFHLLEKFKIVPVEKTPIPLTFNPKSLTSVPKDGFWLGLDLITDDQRS